MSQSIELGHGYAVLGATTDNCGTWHEYWYVPAHESEVTQNKHNALFEKHGGEFFVAFTYDEETAKEIIDGQFWGRSINASPIPEAYIKQLKDPEIQKQLADSCKIVVTTL